MEMLNHRDVVVIGAGHAGAELACTLRKKGFVGSILLISEESIAPYERPPLSKAYLLGSIQIDKIMMRSSDFWEKSEIELALDCRVVSLDADRREVLLNDGRHIIYKWCVLATGGRVRLLSCPGSNLPGIYTLRNVADVEQIRAALASSSRLTVIGAGFIGLEVAAAAREMGKAVTVIEAQRRVLARVTSPPVSQFYENIHRRHGVHFHFGQNVVAIEGTDQVKAVRLDSGESVETDLVVAGIGIDAEMSLAEAAGIDCDGGVLVDEACRTSHPDVLAIGDCSRHPNEYAGGLWRLECVQHAQDSAAVAADTIMGKSGTYSEVPTFWSQQYDYTLQTAGLAKDADDFVVRGNDKDGPLTIVYLQEGRVVAVDAINAPRDFMVSRNLIRNRVKPAREQLSDCAVPLKSLV